LVQLNINGAISLKTLRYISAVLTLLILLPCVALAQDEEEDKPVFPLENFYAKRKKNHVLGILKDFRFSAGLGYGHTFFSHKLSSGFGIYQPTGYAPQLFDANPGIGNRYINWVNTFALDPTTIKPSAFQASADTTKLGFRGKGLNIPLKLSVHYEFLGKYRLGGGYSWEFMSIGQFHPITYKDKISRFKPSDPNGFMKKYFAVLGVSFWRWNDLLFTADANVGGFKPGKNFNSSLIKKGVYANVGVTVERDLSEYLKLYVRPSFEIKNYTLNLPEGEKSISHSINAFYVNFGLTYAIPELPRCYNKDCHAQINHAHGDREYRSRRHKIWKWQNPNYGQNNPTLIKYKGKNKKKLNPY